MNILSPVRGNFVLVILFHIDLINVNL